MKAAVVQGPEKQRREEARSAAALYRIAIVEREASMVFARRLEYFPRTDHWQDLKTGECGAVKGRLSELLGKFFPQREQVQNGGRQ
jgi:hypothetical protein